VIFTSINTAFFNFKVFFMVNLKSHIIPLIISNIIILNHCLAQTQHEDKTSGNNPMYMLTYDHGGLILWGTDHFEERLDNAIEWLDKYPGFKIGLDNEAYVYDYLSENQPELLKKVQDYLSIYEGRFGIGSCTYGQPLSTFIGGESNIRQISYALEANQKYFNYKNRIYLMSEHAMHAQIPQILVGFNFEGAIMRTHYMMYGYNPTYNEPFGWWVGMDGSRIPTVPTYTGEGAEFGRTPVDNWILTRYPGSDAQSSLRDFRIQFQHIDPLLATRADDSDLRKEALVQEYDGNTDFKWILLDEMLSLYPEPEAEFRTLPDDFSVRMPWGYCGNEIWNKSRKAEVRILTIERLAALNYFINGINYEDKIDKAWKHLLLAQHHDIQIVGLLPDARKHIDLSLNESKMVQKKIFTAFAEKVNGDGAGKIIVFNPVSWARKGWVRTKVQFKRGQAKDVAVYCDDESVKSVILEADRFSSGHIMECEVAFLADFKTIGLKTYSIHPLIEAGSSQVNPVIVEPENLKIQTPVYDIQLSENGGIRSLTNIKSGEAIFKPGKRNGYLTGLIDGKECESSGKWIISKINPKASWIDATEYGFIADIPYEIQLRIEANSSRMDWKVTLQLDSQRIGQLSDHYRDSSSPFIHEKKLRFKFYPDLGKNVNGIRDLPFVVAKTDNKYIQGNYWAALEDDTKGIATFNKGTMCLIKEKDGGSSIPLIYAMYYIWGTRMLRGEYEFEFALQPYSGHSSYAEIHKDALIYNFPLIYESVDPRKGSSDPNHKILDIDNDNIILSALYVDNGKIISRFFNCTDAKTQSGIHIQISDSAFIETDLLGNTIKKADHNIVFEPWQFKTFELIQ
jgi:hypothetical protein